ncbi:unnamed protein product [Rotaria magnacalcarata]|uniref:F-box domain-containing protein n=2 Tax=Rotaria magnacalcarata TaxID=392030 RepID=A0A816A3W4_9BILA|nr:unnamed protein product [Rotaria magnacalcarata]
MNLSKVIDKENSGVEIKRTSSAQRDEENIIRKRLKINSIATVASSVNKDDVDRGHQIDTHIAVSKLELLPNELLYVIVSHLHTSCIVQAFHGLNQRFNSIVFQSIRNFDISNYVSRTWLLEYMPRITDAIVNMSLRVDSLPYAFPYENFYRNLTSMVLKHTLFTVEFNVENDGAFATAVTCFNTLSQCGLTAECCRQSNLRNNGIVLKKDDQSYTIVRAQPCLAIKRLDIRYCSEQDLVDLCGLMPNLTSLRVRVLAPSTNVSFQNDLFDVVSRFGSLTRLHLGTSATGGIHIDVIEWLIRCYQSSLEQVTLVISSSDAFIDGYHLQKILEPCQNLKKISFTFEFDGEDISVDINDLCRQFQSEWWLNALRAPVLVIRDQNDRVFIGSIPLYFPINMIFPTDLNLWRLNKGQLDSSMLRFTDLRSIHFYSNNEQAVTFDLLRFIDRVFPSCNQTLTLNYWKFDSPQKLFTQWINSTLTIPTLNRVAFLNMKTYACNGLDAMSLILWLLAVPNVKVLNLESMKNADKVILIKTLDQLLSEDDRVKSILDRIEQVHIWKSRHETQTRSKRNLYQIISKIFSNANLGNL